MCSAAFVSQTVPFLGDFQEMDVLLPSLYSRDAATATAGVNDRLIVAAMAQAATGTRPLIMPYLWLWPHAQLLPPVLLDAGVQVSGAFGADGLILWGSYSDVCRGQSGSGDNSTLCIPVRPVRTTQCGQCSTTRPVVPNIKGSCHNTSGFLNGSAGTLLAQCKDYAVRCAATSCSGSSSRRRDCHSAVSPSPCSRCFKGWRGMERGVSAKQ